MVKEGKKKLTKPNTIKKKAMIEALTKSLGIVTTACKSVGITRTTHYDWLKKDKQYKQEVEEIQNIAIEFAQSKLYECIKDKSIPAIIFYLKNRDPVNWKDKPEVEVNIEQKGLIWKLKDFVDGEDETKTAKKTKKDM